jgi:hypothetical protein
MQMHFVRAKQSAIHLINCHNRATKALYLLPLASRGGDEALQRNANKIISMRRVFINPQIRVRNSNGHVCWRQNASRLLHRDAGKNVGALVK